MEVDRTLIHLAAFGGAFPRASIDTWRRRTKSLAEYVGIFAVERGRLLGQTFVLRVPYTFPSGTEMVSAIAAVVTRPDRHRAGIARGILTEVHRREKEAGVRFSTLWTNRSWGAHRLYETLGYQDVYSSPWAVHAALRVSPRREPNVRPARRSDLPEMERLHSQQAMGRLGFLRAPNGNLTVAVEAGEVDPSKELVVVQSHGRLRGYAQLDARPYRTICGELVYASRSVLRSLVSEVQRRAKRSPFAFQHTPVTDAPELFRGTGFSTVPTGWYVLMANSVGRNWSPAAAVSEFATNDRRFLCMSGDRF
jgi:GNAT superfamily N-acetyltransferase